MLNRYPNIKNAYIRAISDIKKFYNDRVWTLSNEDIFEWWLSGKKAKEYIEDKRQLTIF